MMVVKGSQIHTLWHACHRIFVVPGSHPSKAFPVQVALQPKILELSTGWNYSSQQFFQSYQCFLSFTQRFNSFTLHSFTFPLDTHWISLYLIFTAFINHDTKAQEFSSSSLFGHLENKKIYRQQGSWWRSHQDSRLLQWLSRWQFIIRQHVSLATIQESNLYRAIKRFLPVDIWNTSHSDSMNFYVSATHTLWALEGLYCLQGEGLTRACASGIHDGFWFSVQMIDFAL